MKQKELVKIERDIVTALIMHTGYLKKAINLIDINYMQSKEARIIVSWVFDHFHKYEKAPKQHIQDIFLDKLKRGKIQKSQGEIIELVLQNLSDNQDETDISFLFDQTEIYCKTCQLNYYAEQIQDEIDAGNIFDAESLITNFKPIEKVTSNAIIPLSTAEQIKKAFESFNDPVITYPGIAGQYLNQYMLASSFVVFLGQNKGGKSMILMDAAIRAAKQGKSVAFYQAGDMTQEQMERRIAIYLSKKSDMPEYCKTMLIPVLDCIHNQNDSCDLSIRVDNNDDAPFYGASQEKIQKTEYKEFKEIYKDYPYHKPCYNCLRDRKYHNFKGSVWYKERKKVNPLTWKETYQLLKKKHRNIIDKIRLITYPSESLTMSKINMENDILIKTGFNPQVTIVDYMDLLAPDKDTTHLKPRDQENKKWQRARKFSQKTNQLFLSASQSDAQGFDVKFLSKKNFSEDRRKLDHVTAMLGLNMSFDEKKKGIMRINDIAVRDTEGTNFIYVLHKLQIGRPILNAYF